MFLRSLKKLISSIIMAKKSKKEMLETVTPPTGVGWGNCEQICLYANISKHTLNKWIDDGLRHSRPGGLIRIMYADVDRYLLKFAQGDEDLDGSIDTIIKEARSLAHSVT